MEVPFFFWIFIMLFLMLTELRKWIDMIMEYYEPFIMLFLILTELRKWIDMIMEYYEPEEKEEPLPECIKSMYS